MRLAMSTKQEILRLKGLGHKKNEVAKKLNIQWRTVDHYWDGLPEELDLDPKWTKTIIWDDVLKEINDGARATQVFDELTLEHVLPSYSSFARFIAKLKKKKQLKNIVIRLPKTPGKEVEIDYSGDSIDILSPSSNEILSTELFVACLPSSSYIFAEFTFTQKVAEFISSHVNMFKDLKGVPLFLIPDNAKVAVDKAHRYDPKLNLTYQDMAEHYGVGVSPARVRKPRDKASVERAVGIIQQQFFYKVRDKTYTSIHELNRDLRVWLNEFNAKIIKGRGKSRSELLEEERKCFMELPKLSYEFYHWKSVKVHPDCHFNFDSNYYSVPSKYVGRELVIKYNTKIVMAYFEKEKICSHSVFKGHGHYQTNTSHYPEEKIAHYNFSIQKALKEVKLIGENAEAVINRLLKKGVHPLANLRKIQGIVNLRKKHELDALDYGCEMALESNKLFYQYINSCAKNYKYIKRTSESLLPKRDERFICLQGGFDNDRNTKTPNKS